MLIKLQHISMAIIFFSKVFLSLEKSLNEMFDDVGDTVLYVPRKILWVGVIQDSGNLLYAHEMGDREGSKARTCKYEIDFKSQFDGTVNYSRAHFYYNGRGEQRLCELSININGYLERGELIVSDVNYYKSYPIYCQVFGKDHSSHDIFIYGTQGNLFDKKESMKIAQMAKDRTAFRIQELSKMRNMDWSHGATIRNKCDPNVRKNFYRNLLIGIIFMAAFGLLILGGNVLPLWFSRNK